MLLLIPTEFERSFIESRIQSLERKHGMTVANCGFGPVAAAAATMQLLVDHSPTSVILLGIAGGYADAQGQGEGSARPLAVGSAAFFSSVAVDGIGCGEGASFQTAQAMGWPQWTDRVSGETIGDEISLADSFSKEFSPIGEPPRLLSVCAASATRHQADLRRKTYAAMAEDMEGFSVAMACRMKQIPLSIVRGISNVAGDRDTSRWEIEPALLAAVELLEQTLDTTATGTPSF